MQLTWPFKGSVHRASLGLLLAGIGLIEGRHLHAQATIHHILSTGESLSQGVNGDPPLSTAQPYLNVMLETAGNAFHPGPANFLPVFVPLVETRWETIGSALANSITAQVPGYRSAVTRHGFGYGPYYNIKEGSGYFETGMDQVAKGKAAAGSTPYEVSAVTVIHGELDAQLRTGPSYAGFLLELQQSYVKGVRQIIPNAPSFPLLTDQLGSWANFIASSKTPVMIAQLAAAEDYPNNVILVGPKYQLRYGGDKLHLINTSYRWLGEYYGKVYRRVVINRQPWRPLMPQRVERQGQVITATFFVPVPPLQWDTSIVTQRKNYGFEYVDSSTNPPAIQKVELTGPNTVRVTLNAVPKVGVGHLRYAYSGQANHAGGDDTQGVGGNLRDSDSTPSIATPSPNNLANWCVDFDKPVVSTLDPIVLLSPVNGAYVPTGTSVRLAADVLDRNALKRVDFYDGNQVVGSAASAPYETRWTPSHGQHQVRAVAVYSSASVASSKAALTVNDLPNVSMTSPKSNATVRVNTATGLQAVASDDGAILRVDFWYSREGEHWIRIGSGVNNAGVYTKSWKPTLAGNYRIYAQALDRQDFARYSAINLHVQ